MSPPHLTQSDRDDLVAVRVQQAEMIKQLREAIVDLKLLLEDHEKRIRYLEKIIVFGVALLYIIKEAKDFLIK
jgi:hypothetical protein